MSTNYGDLDVALHGRVAVIREIPTLLRECFEKNDTVLQWISDDLASFVGTIDDEIENFVQKTADNIVTVEWKHHSCMADAVLLYIDDIIVDAYPELEIAVKAKIANSITDIHVNYQYYSPAGKNTLLLKKPKLREYINVLDFAQCDVVFPAEADWIPWIENPIDNGYYDEGIESYIRIHGAFRMMDEIKEWIDEEAMFGDEDWQDTFYSFQEEIDSLGTKSADEVVTIELEGYFDNGNEGLSAIEGLAASVPELEMAIVLWIGPTEGAYRYFSPAGKNTILEDKVPDSFGAKPFFVAKQKDVKFPDVDWIPADWNED